MIQTQAQHFFGYFQQMLFLPVQVLLIFKPHLTESLSLTVHYYP